MVFIFLNIVIYEFQETHKLQAISFCYEIHSLKKQLKEMKIRVDDQLKRTETKKKEVSRLREEISRLKIMTSYIKNGVPTNKIDVRPGRKLSEESNSTSLSNTRSKVKGTTPVTWKTIKFGGFPFFSRLLSRPIVFPLNNLKLLMTVSVMVWSPAVWVTMWNMSVT